MKRALDEARERQPSGARGIFRKSSNSPPVQRCPTWESSFRPKWWTSSPAGFSTRSSNPLPCTDSTVTVSRFSDRVTEYEGEIWWLPLSQGLWQQKLDRQAFYDFLFNQARLVHLTVGKGFWGKAEDWLSPRPPLKFTFATISGRRRAQKGTGSARC